MTQFGRNNHRFDDTLPDEVAFPDLNPYLKAHREVGLPVVTADLAQANKGRWREHFGADRPLHVEIGSGNGFYLSGMARKHPEQSWLGIEIRYKRVVLCARKIKAMGVEENARIARYDAWWLEDVFAPGEIAGMYINHPDPWAKDKQEKKRLMSPFFAQWMAGALASGAEVRLKTDHLPNVDALQAAIEGLPFEVLGRREDLDRSGLPWPAEDDVITNYQRKFREKGLPVHALLLRRL